ncbi:hypothetical protein HY772_03415 [Candidatus Woesearchaeota archaeon]|nr:hypothetical protein [Candidatus Woesearchaeota archaeon]
MTLFRNMQDTLRAASNKNEMSAFFVIARSVATKQSHKRRFLSMRLPHVWRMGLPAGLPRALRALAMTACGIAVFFLPQAAQAKVDFESKAISIGLEIATNPGGFLYDLHQMGESVVPTRTGRRFTIGAQVLPALLPFTNGNVHGRFNLISEHGSFPQVELFGGVSKFMALDYVDTESVEGAVTGNHYGVSTMWSAHPKARIQLAYEISTLAGKVTFKKKPIEIYGTKLSEIKVNIKESFVLVGAEVLRTNRKYLFTQMGFGMESSRILARIVFVGRAFDWGFTVYPESPLVIYPTMGFRFGY